VTLEAVFSTQSRKKRRRSIVINCSYPKPIIATVNPVLRQTDTEDSQMGHRSSSGLSPMLAGIIPHTPPTPPTHLNPQEISLFSKKLGSVGGVGGMAHRAELGPGLCSRATGIGTRCGSTKDLAHCYQTLTRRIYVNAQSNRKQVPVGE